MTGLVTHAGDQIQRLEFAANIIRDSFVFPLLRFNARDCRFEKLLRFLPGFQGSDNTILLVTPDLIDLRHEDRVANHRTSRIRTRKSHIDKLQPY